MQYGGKYALTESQVMAALLPSEGTSTASVMSYGFDPYYTEQDPFGGSAYAVVTSVAKLVACGVPLNTIHLSLQEFFPRLNDDPFRWGQPFAAMLGAFSAQMGLGIAAIGGKDSMSGSFGELDVPPTLISFACGVTDAEQVISPEFKREGSPVYLLEAAADDYSSVRAEWEKYAVLVKEGKVLSAMAFEKSMAYCIRNMSLGNMLGFVPESAEEVKDGIDTRHFASIIFEASEELDGYRLIGRTQSLTEIDLVPLEKIRKEWESPLESVFPTITEQPGESPLISDNKRFTGTSAVKYAKPKAVIPVSPELTANTTLKRL
jgi:phosphoribosylformylglycinamidine synthase